MSDSTGSVQQRLQSDLTAAMKARDTVRVATIRMLRAALMNAEVAGDEAVELTEEQAIAVLQSEAKKRVEAADAYEGHGRHESASNERAELAVIEEYLPTPLSDDELGALVDEEIARLEGPAGPQMMGTVIKAVRERGGAAVDGGRVAATVRAKLGL